MKPIHQFLLFFAFVFLIFLVPLSIGRPITLDSFLIIFGCALFFSGLGYLIGLIVYELKLKPTKDRNKIYLIGNSIGFLGFIAFMTFAFFSGQSAAQVFRNKEGNHSVMQNSVQENEPYIRVAFDLLESQFANADTFKLNSFTVRAIDTLVNGSQDSLYNVYFTYYVEKDSMKYLSEISVWHGTPIIRMFNVRSSDDAEFLEIERENRQKEHEVMKSLKESLDELRDSTKEKIHKTIK